MTDTRHKKTGEDYSVQPDEPSSSSVSLPEAQNVPWIDRLEWERACNYFNSGDYNKLLVEICVWKQRVPSLPVGVEATLFLIQADLEDPLLFGNSSRNTSEDNVRSMYSLAVIRFLNHVTHLASKDMPSTASMTMVNVVSHVNVPKWIVNIRHEASHGTILPSMETLRLAAQFIKEWLTENYWLCTDMNAKECKEIRTPEFYINVSSVKNRDESSIISKFNRELLAFIACKVYKLRGNDYISDREILDLLPVKCFGGKVKEVTVFLKNVLACNLKSEPFLFCAAVVDAMHPDQQFCSELMLLFNTEEVFPILVLIWKSTIELLEKQGKLVSICIHLADIHVQTDVSEFIQHLSSQWLDYVLEQLEISGKIVSQKLLPVLRTVMKVPNVNTGNFLHRLLRLVESNIGSDNVHKLSTLVNIWNGGSNSSGKVRKKSQRKFDHKLFTVNSLSTTLNESNQEQFIGRVDIVGNWKLDTRGGINFWRRHPCGIILD